MIYQAIDRQINHGPYKSEPIYGNGTAGVKIAQILSECKWEIQKELFIENEKVCSNTKRRQHFDIADNLLTNIG